MTRCPRCQRRFPPSGECTVHGQPTGVVLEAQPEPAQNAAVAPPGWTLAHHIATGGTAQVYAVERAGAPPAILKWGRWRDRDSQTRFALEAEILRTVGAPATPGYIEHGAIDGWPYLIMEHVPGETLAAWMSRHGARGGLGEILAILTRIASAMATVHAAGYVHRDLKPENVLIGPRGARILDFGLAKPVRAPSTGLTQVGVVVGTVHYLAPEQIRIGGIVDPRADIYSFGVIAYEMLLGVPPFTGERRAIEYQHQVVRPAPVLDSRAVPPALDALVLSCLAKQAEARPQSFEDLQANLAHAIGELSTLRGVGGQRAKSESSAPPRPLGREGSVVLAWIEGADPVLVTHTIGEVQGVIVRQKGDGILAAFTESQHDAPLAVALGACRALLEKRCRIVVHVATALVRRSAQGKATVYGSDVEHVERWLPAVPFAGLLMTAAAGASGAPAPDVPGFFRERARDRTDATDAHSVPALVGRTPLVTNLTKAVLSPHPMLIGISGEAGTGKTRVLEAIVEQLRASGREVLLWRARRRFAGDRPDDDRLLETLGAEIHTPRDLILVIDDVDRLSSQLRRALLADDIPIPRILASDTALFEVEGGAENRIAIQLPPLGYADAGVLLREQLRPARLIPDVLVERLAIRGAGNPALLVALARDMKARGAIRRQPGSDEWYVAPDELDTLLAAPGPSWLAASAIEQLPVEVAPIVRTCAALGPRFCADEVAQIAQLADLPHRLAWLVTEGIFVERSGWFEFADAALQAAIYEHVLDERDLVHVRAHAYWLARKNANVVGWLARIAYHAAHAGEPTTAAACAVVLARQARRRGEHDHGELLLRGVVASLAPSLPAELRDVVVELDE